jgi:hypothetical protein
VTLYGSVLTAVELRLPLLPPFAGLKLVIAHDPLGLKGVEVPATDAPLKVIDEGLDDWQTLFGPPASIVNVEVTMR